MPYSPSDIAQLKTLAYHPDRNNVLLAFELIRGNSWDLRLSTPIYWIYNRFLWEQEQQLATETLLLIRQKAPTLLSLGSLFEWMPLSIGTFLQDYTPRIKQTTIQCNELAKALYQLPFTEPELKTMAPFLFRFGDHQMRTELLPSLIRKQHTGVVTLDLSAYQLKQVPVSILTLGYLKELYLDHNQLTTLPDDWTAMSQLEILHLKSNQLSTLPASFVHLTALKRLYIQDNPWNIEELSKILQALPSLEYLSVATASEDVALYQLETLVQHGLLQASEQVQRLFLALELQDPTALEQLSLLELFTGLQHHQVAIRNLARTKLLSLRQDTFNDGNIEHPSIAILGLVSFATHKKLERLEQLGWEVTHKIIAPTTHLLLGDYPERYEAVAKRFFIFLSEQDILAL